MTTHHDEITALNYDDTPINNKIVFGCVGLEHLIDPSNFCYSLSEGGPLVTCIIGPDGVGKSIMSLAAASAYSASQEQPDRRVIYASTDLNYVQAKSTWKHFALDEPYQRHQSLHSTINKHTPSLQKSGHCDLQQCSVSLKWVSPFSKPSERDGLLPYGSIFSDPGDESTRCVHFLDLAEFSAGDDWGHLNRTLGLLADTSSQSGPHLLVVDAVEGLEAMVGERDGFGLVRSRRSRLAQMVRISRKVNCSVLFVVEQKDDAERLDEVFVSDLVLRLRARTKDGYLLKTVEVEKARSKPHIRGEHELQIRGGTGTEGASDDPAMILGETGRTFGYLQVLPSLHVKEIINTNSKAYKLPARRFPEALAEIDLLLKRSGRIEEELTTDGRDRILVTVEESRTYKARLGFSFLAQTFASKGKSGGVILFSSEGHTRDQLLESFNEWGLPPYAPDLQVSVRQIMPAFLSSSELLFRIRTCISEMRERLAGAGIAGSEQMGIRVLIDNWASILEAHPTLTSDPQILQRIFRLLHDEGVLAMIISTQPGSPNAQLDLAHEHNVLRLEARRLHCWPVDFYGGRRVALTSSIASRGGISEHVHELRRIDDTNHRLSISEDFSAYKDLESGQAKPIQLRVKLYSDYHANEKVETSTYADDVSSLFGDLYPSGDASANVVSFESIDRYEGFKEYVGNLHGSKLDHSLVFQVDEFWKQSDAVYAHLAELIGGQGSNSFLPEYSNEDSRVPLHRDFGMVLLDEEAWRSAWEDVIPGWTNRVLACGASKWMVPCLSSAVGTVDDIGCDSLTLDDIESACRGGDALRLQLSTELQLDDVASFSKEKFTVRDIYNSIACGSKASDSERLAVPWSLFLECCRVVARRTGKRPFDVDLRTRETLNSLVLELWLSRIKQSPLMPRLAEWDIQEAIGDQVLSDVKRKYGEVSTRQSVDVTSLLEVTKELDHRLSHLGDDHSRSISTMLGNEHLRGLLIESLSLLSGYLPSKFRETVLEPTKPDTDVVATRAWYGTSVTLQREHSGLIPAMLPGAYCVRGDWFLGVAKGSRSITLAKRAIMNLTSTEMNLKRYREGVGLPVKDMRDLHLADSALTRVQENTAVRATLRDIEELAPASEKQISPVFRSRIQDYGRQTSEFSRLILLGLRVVPPNLLGNELSNWTGYDELVDQCLQVAQSCELQGI